MRAIQNDTTSTESTYKLRVMTETEIITKVKNEKLKKYCFLSDLIWHNFKKAYQYIFLNYLVE